MKLVLEDDNGEVLTEWDISGPGPEAEDGAWNIEDDQVLEELSFHIRQVWESYQKPETT